MQVRKQQLELDMEQQTGSKKEKEAVYCHPAYLSEGTELADVVGWLVGPFNCIVQVQQIEIHQKLTVSQS